jgi:hypothetical protein
MENSALEILNGIAKNCGIVRNTENNGGTQIYRKELFDNLNAKQIKSLRKKLRDNYVIPLLEQICSCKNKEEFNKKEKDFIKLYSSIFANEKFDFSVFGMLRNNNAILAENAQKIWEKFSK